MKLHLDCGWLLLVAYCNGVLFTCKFLSGFFFEPVIDEGKKHQEEEGEKEGQLI